MRIHLAPMEGVVDWQMRELLTAMGGYDLCVTEFIRVVEARLPDRVFQRFCPELSQGARTRAGVPVRIQLLGQHPEWLALNAERAVALGSPGVDLNFGCPAKTVNNSRGGAVLLKHTETLYQILKAVRAAVPREYPVTAKMRLGYDDTTLALDNARALAEGGADEITVHARTKRQGYKPPVYWAEIAAIREVVSVPVIANGDIVCADSARACQRESECQDIMIGRGALAQPNLAAMIRGNGETLSWQALCGVLANYLDSPEGHDNPLKQMGRLKQWFYYLKQAHPEAIVCFEQIKRSSDLAFAVDYLRRAADDEASPQRASA